MDTAGFRWPHSAEARRRRGLRPAVVRDSAQGSTAADADAAVAVHLENLEVSKSPTLGSACHKAQVAGCENFGIAAAGTIEGAMIDRMDRNTNIVSKVLNEDEFKAAVVEFIAKQNYEKARGGEAA